MPRRPRRSPVRLPLAALVAAAALLAPAGAATAARDQRIDAAWRATDLQMDGSLGDWPSLARVDDGPVVAAQNDAETLYLAVASNDPIVREQLARGLVVWLDAAKRKAQTFGVRLEGLQHRPLPGATPDPGTGDPFARTFDLNRLDRFDLLGPAKLQRRLIDNPDDVGIALAAGVEDGTMVYELRLPLAKSDATPYAVGTRPGSTISLGLESPRDPRTPKTRNTLDDPWNTNVWIFDPYAAFYDWPRQPGSSDAARDRPLEPMDLIWTDLRLAAAPAGPADR